MASQGDSLFLAIFRFIYIAIITGYSVAIALGLKRGRAIIALSVTALVVGIYELFYAYTRKKDDAKAKVKNKRFVV